MIFFRNSNNRRTVKSILLVKKFLGLVEMTSGLVSASFSFPIWQAVKIIFFAPWSKPDLNFFSSILGHTLLERYGMTEIGMALSNPLLGPRLPVRLICSRSHL